MSVEAGAACAGGRADAAQRLAESVIGAGRSNPQPAPRYHLVVLGAGSAGLVAAAAAAQLGAKVALVERRAMGGDCLNFACVPSKALLHYARGCRQAREGWSVAERGERRCPADFAGAAAAIRNAQAELAEHDSIRRFERLGVDLFWGHGRFVAPDAVEVGGRRLRFWRALVATGTQPAVPAIAGLAEAGFLTTETVFALTRLPGRLAVIGAGASGCELAQAFGRLGSEVALVETAPRILPQADPDVAPVVARALEADRVRLYTGASIRRVRTESAEKRIEIECEMQGRTLACDEILVAAGRAPVLRGLGLEAAGVQWNDNAGIRVNARMRTSNRRVYAAGDVCSRQRFTHTADAAARVAVRNALFFGRRRLDTSAVPWCVFTEPEVAHVGLDAAQASARGFACRVIVQPWSEVDRAVIEGDTEGFLKIVAAGRRGRILGASAVGTGAGEIIGQIGVAMAAGLGLLGLADVIYAYPTRAQALGKAADAFNRARLTRRIEGLLRAWFKLWR